MSDVLNTRVTSSEEGGFSRRRVVKGVAWSLPVIATAIAAPAAAASPPPATGKIEVLWDFAPNSAVTLVQSGKETQVNMNRAGTGPLSYYLRNTTAADSGAIQGSITITPQGTGTASAGIYSFTMGNLTNAKMTSNVFSADFSLAGGVPRGSMVTFPMVFYYTGNKNTAARGFIVDLSFTSPVGLVIPSSTTSLKLS